MTAMIDYSKRKTWRGGRKPKPTEQKQAAGTLRPCRSNPAEPEGIKIIGLKCPKRFGPAAKSAWETLVPALETLRILTVSDIPALEMLCEAYAEYRKCEDELQKAPLPIYKRKNDEDLSVHPLVITRDRAWDRTRKLMLDFGMTPTARTKVVTIGSDTKTEAQKAKEALFS